MEFVESLLVSWKKFLPHQVSELHFGKDEVPFFTYFSYVRIEVYRGQVMGPNSQSKLEVELSYPCKIFNLVTCEFMSQDMLIQDQTI